MATASKMPKVQIDIPEIYPNLNHIFGVPKDFVKDFLMHMEMAGAFYHMGVEPDKTFLIYGPPGNGKSMAMKVINNEANKKVSLVDRLDSSKFNLVSMAYDIGKYGTAYVNEGSRIIQQFFNFSYRLAQTKQVLLVLDECDALFRSRTSAIQTHSEDMKNLETLMKNLQTAHDTENLYVALMTNLDEILDKAAIRSGRIDKKIKFDLPDEEQRQNAFNREINQVNRSVDYKVIRKYSVEQLAENSEGLNYADIHNTVHASVKRRIEEIFNDNTTKIYISPYITKKYLLQSIEDIKPKDKTKIGF